MAAPEFTLFVKPYLEGWDNGEEGNTPITAEILNENYDAFLLALNDWATSVGLILEEAVTDPNYVHTDNNYTTTEKNKLSGIEANANNYSLPTASASTLGGVKIDGVTITIADGVISAVGGGGTDVEGNPSGTPTAVLSSIRIGQNIYSIPGGGGGGSSVSYSQILATGTKIGTITIDGVPTDIYAPTAPTNTSDLNNDSNFVSDASYVHTDNNYTTTEKNKLADLNQVEANPSSGTSAGDLTSISVGGTKYNIPSGGGGGTTVVANPSGAATDELEKIQIGNVVYSLPEGESEHLLNDILTGPDVTRATASSTSQDGAIWKAFDGVKTGNEQSCWIPEYGSTNCWICYHFSTPKYITKCHVYFYENMPGTYTGAVKIQGSNDGTNWTDISQPLSLSMNNGTHDYEIVSTDIINGYSYVRMFSETALVVYGSPSACTLELEIYGRDNASSSGGHTILDDGGTALAQENNLQFKGAYSHDDSTNGKTVVEVTRVMTSAEYMLLSEPEKKGVIVITDEEPAPVGSTDIIGTLAAGATSITLSSPAITPNSSIEPWTDTYGVVPTNMEVIQSSSILDKEIVLEKNGTTGALMDVTIKNGLGETISSETIDGNNYSSSSSQYVIDGYMSAYCDLGNYQWVITFLKDCEDNGVEKQANDTVRTYYTTSFVTQDIEYFTQGYGVQMTFEARQSALGVKVRVS